MTTVFALYLLRTLEVVEPVGPGRCIIASDVGMLLEPTAVEALRLMIRLLTVLRLTPDQIDPMLKRNPPVSSGSPRRVGPSL